MADVSLPELGWFLSDEGLELCCQNGKSDVDAIIRIALDTDLKDIGKGWLPDDSQRGRTDYIKGPGVLQLQKIRNVSAPKENEESQTAPRLMKLVLSDGHTTWSAIETEVLKDICLGTLPGTKILLKMTVDVEHGFLLLNNKNTRNLGGRVKKLSEAYELKKKLAKQQRSTFAVEGGPPPFVPFGQKLNVDRPPARKDNFKSLEKVEKKVEDDDFEQQRKAIIEEALQAKEDVQTKKFGGGPKVVDQDVAQIIEMGFKVEDAMAALKMSNGNVQQALDHLLQNKEKGCGHAQSATVRQSSYNSDRGRGRQDRRGEEGGFGHGRRGRDIEDAGNMTNSKPSGPATLFDFLDIKIPGKDTKGVKEYKSAICENPSTSLEKSSSSSNHTDLKDKTLAYSTNIDQSNYGKQNIPPRFVKQSKQEFSQGPFRDQSQRHFSDERSDRRRDDRPKASPTLSANRNFINKNYDNRDRNFYDRDQNYNERDYNRRLKNDHNRNFNNDRWYSDRNDKRFNDVSDNIKRNVSECKDKKFVKPDDTREGKKCGERVMEIGQENNSLEVSDGRGKKMGTQNDSLKGKVCELQKEITDDNGCMDVNASVVVKKEFKTHNSSEDASGGIGKDIEIKTFGELNLKVAITDSKTGSSVNCKSTDKRENSVFDQIKHKDNRLTLQNSQKPANELQQINEVQSCIHNVGNETNRDQKKLVDQSEISSANESVKNNKTSKEDKQKILQSNHKRNDRTCFPQKYCGRSNFVPDYPVPYGNYGNIQTVSSSPGQFHQQPEIFYAEVQQPVQFTLNLNIGDTVMAKYWEDGCFYEAVIVGMAANIPTCIVTFTEYGNTEEVFLSDILLPQMIFQAGGTMLQQPNLNMPPPQIFYAPQPHASGPTVYMDDVIQGIQSMEFHKGGAVTTNYAHVDTKAQLLPRGDN